MGAGRAAAKRAAPVGLECRFTTCQEDSGVEGFRLAAFDETEAGFTGVEGGGVPARQATWGAVGTLG